MATTWAPVERGLRASRDYAEDVRVTVRFEHETGSVHEIPAFRDGQRSWRVRFAPPRPGEWTWTVRVEGTEDPALERSGTVGASPAPTGSDRGGGRLREHGFLVAEGRELRHADGTPFFWLGDTVWSAGAKATPGEWRRYADARAEQGFTVAQINALPQHDASLPQNRRPFREGRRPDPDYFRALDAGVAALHDRGIVPALVGLWYDYVAGENPDWEVVAGERTPLEAPAARRLGRYLGARYGAYGTVWLVSGDAEFADGTLPVYDALADGLREACTHPLRTVHTPGGAITPAPVLDRDWLDFHCYQSGHVADLERPATQAQRLRTSEPVRPTLNGEPPYEAHGFFDDTPGRIDRATARRAAWLSLLAGASAGVTYGGHGLWQWHRRGEENRQAARKGRPDPWHEALDLPGARDYARIRSLLSAFDHAGLDPRQDLLDGPDLARAATVPPRGRGGEALLVYTPRARALELDADALADRDPVWRHPGTGETAPATVATDGGVAVVDSPPYLDDGLLVAR
jgi:hypothetical protein